MSEIPSSFTPNSQHVFDVKSMLSHKGLPIELVELIIDFAEYWPHHMAEIEETVSVGNNSTFLYLKSQPVPGKLALEGSHDEQVGKEGVLIGGVHTRTVNPVRRIKFRTWSHDQGWSSNHGIGTYKGSYSWFECFAERPLSTTEAQEAIPFSKPVDITDKETKESGTAWKRVVIPENKQGGDGTDAKSVWHVQCNVHASRDTKTHEVVWTWTDNGGASVNGAGNGGDFVRCLKPGDRISVLARAKYPGWKNIVEKMKIEVYYAV